VQGRAGLVIAAIFALPVGAMLVGTFSGAPPSDEVPLRRIPPGVSARTIDGIPLFLTRTGAEVRATIAGVPERRVIVWCGADARFAIRTTGARLGDGDLAHAAVTRHGSKVRVDGQRLDQPITKRFVPHLEPGWERHAIDPPECARD
jgi:hypothetical protein